MKKQILLIILGLIVLAQFIQPSRAVEKTDPNNDLLVMTNAPAEIADNVKAACYDCHSYETKYPWYSYITPVNWWLNNHIQEGRSEMNFSVWGTYPQGKRDHKAEECGEALREGWMPLDSYTPMHPEADLDQQTRERLAVWFGSIR